MANGVEWCQLDILPRKPIQGEKNFLFFIGNMDVCKRGCVHGFTTWGDNTKCAFAFLVEFGNGRFLVIFSVVEIAVIVINFVLLTFGLLIWAEKMSCLEIGTVYAVILFTVRSQCWYSLHWYEFSVSSDFVHFFRGVCHLIYWLFGTAVCTEGSSDASWLEPDRLFA